ncbi:MAG: SDR family oxidoreductase [Pirellulales bacterium]
MILDLFKLDGRVAVVTGGTRGLGAAMAIGLAEAGADVAIIARDTSNRETAERIMQLGRRCIEIQADVGKSAERAGLIDRVVAGLGRIDILVNNAGGGTRHPPEDFPLAEWHQTLEVHLTATFELSQQAARHMLPQGRGKIINVGSIMCDEAGWNIPAYAAAKHGIAAVTKSLGTAWASKGIAVNCIAPGYFATTYSHVLMNDAVRGPQIMDRIPHGRWGDPRELAALAVFLASDACQYMNGSIVAIDGGWLAR